MKIIIGGDHSSVALKEAIGDYIKKNYKFKVKDIGTHKNDSVDYPDYGYKIAQEVAKGSADRGIVICGTGIGISIAANKVKGIRAAMCYDAYTAIMSRKHNDANVLAIGARTTLLENALIIVDLWLKTEFEGGRHQKRVELLNSYPSR
ncbi:MAG: ribose 5-phosphate isomerase B [Candidatus Margulisbacteria bacterium]|nr:ribose 5-phosphate isomerase B [Candidatus Margulisiibacteriota bacterium]